MVVGRCLMPGLVALMFVLTSVSGTGDVIPTAPIGTTAAASVAREHFRISEMSGGNADVAYNPVTNEFLTVWQAGHIYGQRVDAATGARVAAGDLSIEQMLRGSDDPAVTYNAVTNEYLVVWNGDDYSTWHGDQIYGQLLSAEGVMVGAHFLIDGGPRTPFVGTCGSPSPITCYPSQYPSRFPAVTVDGQSGDYLIAWWKSFPTPGDFGTTEAISAARLTSNGAISSTAVVTVESSATGGRLFRPAIAYNSAVNEALVLFVGLRDQASVFASRLDWRATPFGPIFGLNNSTLTDVSQRPTVAYNPRLDEFLVVWSGYYRDTVAPGQIFGQRLSGACIQLGPDDFRISDAPMSLSESASRPSLTHDPQADEYLVAWDDTRAPSGQGIMGQRLTSSGLHIGPNDFLLTSKQSWASGSRLAYNSRNREFVVVFEAFTPSARQGVYGFRYVAPEPFVVGAGRGGTGEFQSWAETAEGFARQNRLTLPWPAYNRREGEIHPAAGDVDGDGLDEIVVGLGAGGQGWIAIFDDSAHGYALLRWVQLPWPAYNLLNGAIWPTAGDIDGDGRAEIVAGLGNMGQGFIAVFEDSANGYAFRTWRRIGWPWYAETQSGETHPAIANIDGGDESEIVVGLGFGGGGWLEVMGGTSSGFAHRGWLRVAWPAYNTLTQGVTYPAGGDLDGDGHDEIVVGLGRQSDGWVEIFRDTGSGLAHMHWLQVSLRAYAYTVGEIHPAVGDVDGDPPAEILLGLDQYPGQGARFEIRDDATQSYVSRGLKDFDVAEGPGGGTGTFPAVGRFR